MNVATQLLCSDKLHLVTSIARLRPQNPVVTANPLALGTSMLNNRYLESPAGHRSMGSLCHRD
jgi:hypothetical protein